MTKNLNRPTIPRKGTELGIKIFPENDWPT